VLEVDPLAGGIRREQESGLAVVELVLDFLALVFRDIAVNDQYLVGPWLV